MHSHPVRVTRAARRIMDREFIELAERFSPRLLAYFTRRVQPIEDAADLLSETLLVAWRRRAAVPHDVDNEQIIWLFSVAANVLSNHRRGRRRSNQLVDALRSALIEEARDDTAVSDVRITVLRALDAVPAASAEIVRLVHWDGLTLTEAGQLLGITASAARSRYATARARLHDELTRHEEGDRTAAPVKHN